MTTESIFILRDIKQKSLNSKSLTITFDYREIGYQNGKEVAIEKVDDRKVTMRFDNYKDSRLMRTLLTNIKNNMKV